MKTHPVQPANRLQDDLHGMLYRTMCLIRRFEETVLDEFPRGHFYGTTHTYLGQEANAVGVLHNLFKDDIIVSNHRCHGHFLAAGGDPRALFAELMGRSTGVCGGRGGSQHLHWENFYSNGVLGGTVPLAVGMAMAEKIKKSGAIVVAFLGDGTLGEGIVYESLNMASLWSLPILFVLEDNRLAQTTPLEKHLAGDIASRFTAFGIKAEELDTSDVVLIQAAASAAIDSIRTGAGPGALVLHTCRFGPHSKGDDPRPKEEIEHLRKTRDPLALHAPRVPLEKLHRIEMEVAARVRAAYQQALNDPFPELRTAL
jgi:TPP-dependent pyruvate/acetoin dehydrogenase alpha subunit